METFYLPTSDISLTDVFTNNSVHEIVAERKSSEEFRNVSVNTSKLQVMVRKQSCYRDNYVSLLV